MVCVVIVMVMRNIRPFGYHSSSYDQARSVVVFISLTDTTNDRHNKYTEYQDEHQREHHSENPESEIKSKSHVICLSV